ncbi:MAG: peptidoglycan-binding protein [Oscillospiraceae bacterium]|nr:peptidoglycan-binding protein [Oscillospiraceae bacterium]
MRPEETFVAQPVRSLQQMLRTLHEQDSSHLQLIPDGIYGRKTLEAVSVFQRLHGLPVTGVTDQATWEAIAAAHEPALVETDHAQPVEIILNTNQRLRRGESSPYLFVAQSMLLVLAQEYASVTEPTHSGILDEATAQSVASFQALAGLPQTGEVDKITWKYLALHFPLAANKN